MKTKLLFGLSLAMLSLVSCTQDINEVELNPSLGVVPQINIDGSVNQEYVSRVDDGGFCTGDQIGLYGVNYTDNNTLAGELLDEGNQVDNARYTFDKENWVWKSAGSIYYKDAETNIDLYGYYPYASPKSVRAYEFEVQRDQSGENNIDGYSLSDFLWGKAENIVPTENKVKLRFNHRLACANVVLVEGDGFAYGEFESLKKQVLALNTQRKAIIDLQTGEVEATGEVETEGIVMKSNAEGFRAIVVPQTMTAGTALFAITLNGINYRFKNTSTDVSYKSGMQTNFTIELKKKSHSGEYELSLVSCEIVDWVADLEAHGGEARQYYVVHQDEPGTLSAKLREAKKNPAKIKNLKVSGKIDAADFYFMRDSMDILQAINLKESEILALTKASAFRNGLSTNKSWENNSQIVSGYITTYYYGGAANEIPERAFSNKSSLYFFSFPEKVTKISDGAFFNAPISQALIIPNDVVEIGEQAFSQTNISSLKLPYGLKKMRWQAFRECRYLSGTLSLPDSLELIEDQCFSGCEMLTGNLVLPSKLTSIPQSCFYGCKGFTGDLVIPDGVTDMGSSAFYGCTGLNGTLTLPEGLKYLPDTAFSGCKFKGELRIPRQVEIIYKGCFRDCLFTRVVFAENSELKTIEGGSGSGVFAGCNRISEPIILPEGLIVLGYDAFWNCTNLPAVVLPKSINTIGNRAFANCYNLSAITCNATTPPVCGSGAWDGVAKDNFAVEVPEQSVVKYQTASGWSDFKRIAAHHDFSLSRSLLRTLNASHSATFVMRAPSGMAWSVESAPEWLTVTPLSGVGKVDVTITVNEMTAAEVGTFKVAKPKTSSTAAIQYTTHNGRANEVVFLLEGKDYRTTLKVEQYDYQYGDGDVLVNQTASEGAGVNIVFMGDCFDAKDIADGSYLKGVEEAIGHYFGIEPYKTYRDYFNVYTVFGMSADSGMGTVNTIKDAKFGSQYSLDGISPDHATCYEYAMKAETVNENNLSQTLVVLVENTQDYGGICYMWGDGSAIACCPMSADAYPFDFRGIVQHEAGGHGFGKLGDEYIYHNAFIQSCTCICCEHLKEFNAAKARGWYRNLSTNGNMKTVEWSHLIFHPDYSNIVDMYEGGFFHTRGIYRSESSSCMNNNIPYYSAISRQAMVECIMEYAGKKFDINDFYAKDVRDASNNTTRSLVIEENVVTMTGAGKQLPPKYMGDKPQLKKSNK